jgi:hypothetical protein
VLAPSLPKPVRTTTNDVNQYSILPHRNEPRRPGRPRPGSRAKLGALTAGSFTVLPASLHSLIRLIKRWAVPDDGERAALLEDATEAELSDLVTTVEPLFEEIDDYIQDSTEGSMPAVYIGALAECTVEARLYLDRLGEENR